MAGVRNGVAVQITNDHALNLAAGDTVKQNKVLRNTLDTTLEISKLIKWRDAIFHKLKEELAP